MIVGVGVGGVEARTVEAVCAYALFGQANACDKVFDGAEFERCEAETACDFGYHAVVLGCAGGGVSLDTGLVVAFEVLYYAACYELEVALG